MNWYTLVRQIYNGVIRAVFSMKEIGTNSERT